MVRYMNWTPSAMVSVLQLPAHLKLKERHVEQQALHLDATDHKTKLELKEAEAYVDKERFDLLSEKQRSLMLQYSQNEERKQKLTQWIHQHAAIEHKPATNPELPADSPNDQPLDDDHSLLSSSDSDDEDDNDHELLRELQKLKEESHREAETQNELHHAQQLHKALSANPLLSTATTTTSLKRKWNSNTIFTDQAKNEKRKRPRFINDTLRSDFHKDFMNQVMK